MTADKMPGKSTDRKIEATPAILVVTMLFFAGRIEHVDTPGYSDHATKNIRQSF